jgi:uncharacterized protein (TIGR03435 family)
MITKTFLATRATIARKVLLAAAGLLLIAAPMAYAQSSPAPTQPAPQAASAPAVPPTFVFDVASIKPNKSGTEMVMMRGTQNGLSATNVSVLALISRAYGIQEFRISGAPSWVSSDRYDIEAKVDDATAAELQKLDTAQRNMATQQMIQALLADRCKLTVHHETKDLPEFALVIAKNGPKLQEAKPDDTYPGGFKGPNGASGAGMMRMSLGGQVTGQGVSLIGLVAMLSAQLGVTILDKTGLTGKYDFTLKYTPEMSQSPIAGGAGAGTGAPPPPDASEPSLFTALEEQLGLKLESQKGPVDIIVIDHVEPPSEN